MKRQHSLARKSSNLKKKIENEFANLKKSFPLFYRARSRCGGGNSSGGCFIASCPRTAEGSGTRGKYDKMVNIRFVHYLESNKCIPRGHIVLERCWAQLLHLTTDVQASLSCGH